MFWWSGFAGLEMALLGVVEETPVAGDEGEIAEASCGGEDAVVGVRGAGR
jgi:hypothetical protein